MHGYDGYDDYNGYCDGYKQVALGVGAGGTSWGPVFSADSRRAFDATFQL